MFHSRVPGAHTKLQLPANQTLGGGRDGSSDRAPAHHVGALAWVPGSQLWPQPCPSLHGHLRGVQEDGSNLSLFFFVCENKLTRPYFSNNGLRFYFHFHRNRGFVGKKKPLYKFPAVFQLCHSRHAAQCFCVLMCSFAKWNEGTHILLLGGLSVLTGCVAQGFDMSVHSLPCSQQYMIYLIMMTVLGAVCTQGQWPTVHL